VTDSPPGTEFDHFLAQKLSMTVGQLRESMGNDEYVRWGVYYAKLAQQAELERLRGHHG
jgi:hypothetical protein